MPCVVLIRQMSTTASLDETEEGGMAEGQRRLDSSQGRALWHGLDFLGKVNRHGFRKVLRISLNCSAFSAGMLLPKPRNTLNAELPGRSKN